MKINKKIEKKLYNTYMKAVIKITEKIIKENKNNREIVAPIVSDMITDFTDYLMSFGGEVMTSKEQDFLTNIINEALLKVGSKVEEFVPDSEYSMMVAIVIGKMILKTNKILYNGKY
jgi:hypothetical protein